MKMSKARVILVSGYTLLTCAFATAFMGSLAWFASNVSIPRNDYIGESKSAFFGGGDGTENSPYIISNTRHYYNLCWLQYLGRFNEKGKDSGTIEQIYFKLDADLDFKNFGSALPPIGTTKYPFVGSFEGGEHVIKNLTVTDEYSKLTFHPAAIDLEGNEYHASEAGAINYCSIIGAFGVIGYSKTGASDVADSSIYDFSETQLKANSVSNLYVDQIVIAPKTSKALAGLLAGYVSANMTNCGVHYSAFQLANATNIDGKFNSKVSRYGLIGDYNSDAYSWEGHGSESGDNFGTSIEIKALYDKMSKISDFTTTTTKSTIPSGYAVPFNFDSSSSVVTPTGSPSSVTSSGKTISPSYAKTLTASSSGSNIGYYVGEGIEVYNHIFSGNSSDSNYVDYSYDNMQTATNSSVSASDISDHLKEIQAFLEADDGNGGRKGDSAVVTSKTVLTENAAPPSSNTSYTVVKEAKVGSSTINNLFLPISGIWVAPTKAGRFEFVAVNATTTGFMTNAYICVYRFQRNKDGGGYSAGFLNTKFAINDTTNFSGGMVGAIIPGKSNAYKPYYYGVNITEDDINNGYEFFITRHNILNINAYIVYMDIGAVESGDDTTKTGALQNIDFVFANANGDIVKITDSSWSNSSVYFEISGQGSGNLTYFYFKRKEGETGVLYFEEKGEGSALVLTKKGDGNASKASDAKWNSASS